MSFSSFFLFFRSPGFQVVTELKGEHAGPKQSAKKKVCEGKRYVPVVWQRSKPATISRRIRGVCTRSDVSIPQYKSSRDQKRDTQLR